LLSLVHWDREQFDKEFHAEWEEEESVKVTIELSLSQEYSVDCVVCPITESWQWWTKVKEKSPNLWHTSKQQLNKTLPIIAS
jgi:hypothetical protein